MKYLLILLMAFSFNAFALDACMSGSWYDKERNGEGISLEVLDDTTVGYFYTFGVHDRAWFTMIGDGVMTMYATMGVGETVWAVGDASIERIDNDTISFKYGLVLDLDKKGMAIPWCLGDHCSGDYVYARLTQPIACEE